MVEYTNQPPDCIMMVQVRYVFVYLRVIRSFGNEYSQPSLVINFLVQCFYMYC